MNRLLLYILLPILASLTGCTTAKHVVTDIAESASVDRSIIEPEPAERTSRFSGSEIRVKHGQGELGNEHKTKRTELHARLNYNPVHVAVRHEILDSFGVIDQANDSLIDGTRTAVGVGLHTDRGTYATIYYDEKYVEIELKNKNVVRWGMGPIIAFNHLNKHNGDVIHGRGSRKTTSGTVGIFKKLGSCFDIEATVTTRNNTIRKVDDYFLSSIGCTW